MEGIEILIFGSFKLVTYCSPYLFYIYKVIKKLKYILFISILASAYQIKGQSMSSGVHYPDLLSNIGPGAFWNDTLPTTNVSNSDSDYVYTTILTSDTRSTELRCGFGQIFVPDSATVTGIVVHIEKSIDFNMSPNPVKDLLVQFRIAGIPVGQNKAYTTNWPIADSTSTYGDSTDTWGVSWTPSDFNTNDVSLGIQVEFADTTQMDSATALINLINIEVFYETPTANLPSLEQQEISYLYPLNSEFKEYQIEEYGQAKIYNKEGQMIRSMNTPSTWDGTDSSGNLLPMGIYYLISNDETVYPIMIIK